MRMRCLDGGNEVRSFVLLLLIFCFISLKLQIKKKRVKLRPDWEAVKVRVMYDGNRAKFEQHPEKAANLVSSGRGRIHFGARFFFFFAILF